LRSGQLEPGRPEPVEWRAGRYARGPRPPGRQQI